MKAWYKKSTIATLFLTICLLIGGTLQPVQGTTPIRDDRENRGFKKLDSDSIQWQEFYDEVTGTRLQLPENWYSESDPTFLMSMSSSASVLSRHTAFGSHPNLLSAYSESFSGCRVDLYASLAPLEYVNSPALRFFPEAAQWKTGRNHIGIPKLEVSTDMSLGDQHAYREVYLAYQGGAIALIMWATDEAILDYCHSVFATIEDSLASTKLGGAGQEETFDIATSAGSLAQTNMPKFMQPPFVDSSVYIEQGWRYTYSENNHNGIDYMKGGPSGEHFDVVASASGNATYLGYKDGWGHTVVTEYLVDNIRYYVLYAHLETWYIDANHPQWKQVTAGDYIGVSGKSGSGSGGVIHLHLELSTDAWGYSTTRFDPYDIYGFAKSYPGGGDYVGVGQNHSWNVIPNGEDVDGVIIYEHPYYQGARLVLNQDDLDLCDNPLDSSLGTIECFTAPSWTNNASSIKVPPGWYARLHKHNIADAERWGDDAFQGLLCDQDIENFGEHTFPDGLTLDNEVSRIYVYRCGIGATGQVSGAAIQSVSCQPEPGHEVASDMVGEAVSEATYSSYLSTLKVKWYVENIGSTTWGPGYTLEFVGGEKMGASDSIDVPVTIPGEHANLNAEFVVPNVPGEHAGYWRLRNYHGTYFGPELIAKATVAYTPPPQNSDTEPLVLTCSNCPSSVSAGQIMWPAINVKVNQGELIPSRGDMLRNTDGNLFGAYPNIAVGLAINVGQSIELQFYPDYPIRAPDSPGIYESKWRIWRNGGWDGPELVIRFEVKASGSTNRPPNPPTLAGPGDWAVYTGNGGIVLSAQQNGDPDNDAVAEYYFDIFDSAQNANSGWINSSTWSPQGLGYNGYQWRVKVRDSRGAESGWSQQVWHFTIQTNEPQIYSFSSQACRSAWGNAEQICFCAQTNAGALRLQVNSATDGSANGTWQVLNELGMPNYNCNSDSDRPPTWTQLEYAAGRHLVRLYARRDEGWQAAASRDIYIDLPESRRPDSPGIHLPVSDSFVNNRTVLFDWKDTLRTTSYRLQVGTDNNLINLLLDRIFTSGTSQYEHTFTEDHPVLYVRVTATGPNGSNDAGHYFYIDRTSPTSSVVALPGTSTDSKVTVQWNGSDTQSGLNWYHIQVRDGNRTDSTWQDWLVNTTKTAEIFTGLTGHTYYFRSRAMDKVGNWEEWPAGNGDTVTTIDPTAIPPTVWWNRAYQIKRNLVVLNNDADVLPTHFPVRLHFDGATSPTAAEIYAASLAPSKGNDVRIVYNNQTELNRVVYSFSPTAIDIWFPAQVDIGGYQSDSSSYQLYVGNAAAGVPPTDTNSVFAPSVDGNTMGLWHFQEGANSAVYDSSGRGHTGNFTDGGWTTSGLGLAGVFNGSNSTVSLGNHGDFDNLGAFTLEAWIQPSRSGWGMVFNKGINGYGQYSMRVTGDNNIECSVGADGGGKSVFSNTRLQVGIWYHVACVHDGGSNQWVYVNGNQAGANSNSKPALARTYPLYFGNAPYWGGMAFGGHIQHVRISNVARHDFPYAKIETMPTVAAGSPMAPPIEGSADLAVLSVAVYPDITGGHVVQAVVTNQGNVSTQNGFYSDLYVDHLPTGAGDYSGSVHFWVNSPIDAGATVTLTGKLANLVTVVAAAETSSVPPEASSSIYFQTDSTGVVKETSKSNNVTASGIDVCTTVPDAFEGDNGLADAATMVFDTPQYHNFYAAGDEDWMKFQAISGNIYTFETSQLGFTGDTYLYLYDGNGSTVLAANDDNGENLASRIEWTAPASSQYYLRIRHWNPNIYGCGTSYAISASQQPGASPDLVVTDMRIGTQRTATCSSADNPLGIFATMANMGTADAGTFLVDINGVNRLIEGGLSAGSAITLWHGSYNSGNNSVNVDSDERIAEGNEGNNILIRTLPIPTALPPCQQQTDPTPTPIPNNLLYLPAVTKR